MSDFKNDNDYSFKFNNELEKIYNLYFDNIVDIEVIYDDFLQKQWIDKKITFLNWETIYIDDKVRRKFYWDILIEEWSNVEEWNIWWWFNDEYKTDYIFYYFPEEKLCYIFSHKELIYVMKNIYEDIKIYRKTTKTYVWDSFYTTSFFTLTIDKLRNNWLNIDIIKLDNI